MNIYEVIQLAKRFNVQHESFLKEAGEYLNQKDAVLKMIKEVGLQLFYVSDDLKKDRDVVLASVKKDGYNFLSASPELFNDKEIVMAAIKSNPNGAAHVLKIVPQEMKDDPEVALLALSKNIYSIEHLSKKYRGDREFFLNHPYCANAYPFLTDELKADRDITIKSVSGLGENLNFASNEHKDDEEIVMLAVKNNGDALEYASERLRSNPIIVKAAVRNEWSAINFASESIRNNEDVMMYAIKKDPHYFDLASDELKNNRKFVLNVIKLDLSVLVYASKEIQDELGNESDPITYLQKSLKKKKTLRL